MLYRFQNQINGYKHWVRVSSSLHHPDASWDTKIGHINLSHILLSYASFNMTWYFMSNDANIIKIWQFGWTWCLMMHLDIFFFAFYPILAAKKCQINILHSLHHLHVNIQLRVLPYCFLLKLGTHFLLEKYIGFSNLIITFNTFELFCSLNMTNMCNHWGPDASLNTKMDHIDLCHIHHFLINNILWLMTRMTLKYDRSLFGLS